MKRSHGYRRRMLIVDLYLIDGGRKSFAFACAFCSKRISRYVLLDLARCQILADYRHLKHLICSVAVDVRSPDLLSSLGSVAVQVVGRQQPWHFNVCA